MISPNSAMSSIDTFTVCDSVYVWSLIKSKLAVDRMLTFCLATHIRELDNITAFIFAFSPPTIFRLHIFPNICAQIVDVLCKLIAACLITANRQFNIENLLLVWGRRVSIFKGVGLRLLQ